MTFLGYFRLYVTSFWCLVDSIFEIEHHYRILPFEDMRVSTFLVELINNFSCYFLIDIEIQIEQNLAYLYLEKVNFFDFGKTY